MRGTVGIDTVAVVEEVGMFVQYTQIPVLSMLGRMRGRGIEQSRMRREGTQREEEILSTPGILLHQKHVRGKGALKRVEMGRKMMIGFMMEEGLKAEAMIEGGSQIEILIENKARIKPKRGRESLMDQKVEKVALI
jgi:hypothetical protein